MNENMVWTDSQDYGAGEILCTSKITLLYKTTRFTSEIITLFRVSPQLFRAFRETYGDTAGDGAIIYAGRNAYKLDEKTWAVPWTAA